MRFFLAFAFVFMVLTLSNPISAAAGGSYTITLGVTKDVSACSGAQDLVTFTPTEITHPNGFDTWVYGIGVTSGGDTVYVGYLIWFGYLSETATTVTMTSRHSFGLPCYF